MAEPTKQQSEAGEPALDDAVPCAEYQPDGVPCDNTDTDCVECEKSGSHSEEMDSDASP